MKRNNRRRMTGIRLVDMESPLRLRNDSRFPAGLSGLPVPCPHLQREAINVFSLYTQNKRYLYAGRIQWNRHFIPYSAFEFTTSLFLLNAPHCLKKNGTRAERHWSRISTTHALIRGRAFGPDSPPTMTQWIPVKSSCSIGPSKGSRERNLIFAPVWRKSPMRKG
jgi:hypothetical protein